MPANTMYHLARSLLPASRVRWPSSGMGAALGKNAPPISALFYASLSNTCLYSCFSFGCLLFSCFFPTMVLLFFFFFNLLTVFCIAFFFPVPNSLNFFRDFSFPDLFPPRPLFPFFPGSRPRVPVGPSPSSRAAGSRRPHHKSVRQMFRK